MVIRVALLAPKPNVRVAIGAIADGRRIGNAVGRSAVADDEVVTRVLLIRPLNVHLGTLVVVEALATIMWAMCTCRFLIY